MKRFLLAAFALLGAAQAQLSVPGVSIGIQSAPPLTFELAQRVLIQPARLETSIAAGRSTGILTFTLMSPVNTEVFVRTSDPRLVVRGDPTTPLQLLAYSELSLNLVALEPHRGSISVLNREGAVIATVPYVVAAPKQLNQSASVSYLPSYNRLGASYSVSGVPTSPLDPTWSLNVNLGLDTKRGSLTEGVSLTVNW